MSQNVQLRRIVVRADLFLWFFYLLFCFKKISRISMRVSFCSSVEIVAIECCRLPQHYHSNDSITIKTIQPYSKLVVIIHFKDFQVSCIFTPFASWFFSFHKVFLAFVTVAFLYSSSVGNLKGVKQFTKEFELRSWEPQDARWEVDSKWFRTYILWIVHKMCYLQIVTIRDLGPI